MPELPEVEIFKRYLDATSLHQRIDDVDVRNTYILKETSARELARGLKGRRFESSRRHGKHLFVRVDRDLWLRLHFGMTGSLQYFKNAERARDMRECCLFLPTTIVWGSTINASLARSGC